MISTLRKIYIYIRISDDHYNLKKKTNNYKFVSKNFYKCELCRKRWKVTIRHAAVVFYSGLIDGINQWLPINIFEEPY